MLYERPMRRGWHCPARRPSCTTRFARQGQRSCGIAHVRRASRPYQHPCGQGRGGLWRGEHRSGRTRPCCGCCKPPNGRATLMHRPRRLPAAHQTSPPTALPPASSSPPPLWAHPLESICAWPCRHHHPSPNPPSTTTTTTSCITAGTRACHEEAHCTGRAAVSTALRGGRSLRGQRAAPA